MAEHSKEEVFHGLNATINKHLRDAYGPPKPEDNLPAHVAVALLQISLRYFTATGAPKKVVRHFFEELMGLDEAEKPKSRIVHPAMGQLLDFGKKK